MLIHHSCLFSVAKFYNLPVHYVKLCSEDYIICLVMIFIFIFFNFYLFYRHLKQNRGNGADQLVA